MIALTSWLHRRLCSFPYFAINSFCPIMLLLICIRFCLWLLFTSLEDQDNERDFSALKEPLPECSLACKNAVGNKVRKMSSQVVSMCIVVVLCLSGTNS